MFTDAEHQAKMLDVEAAAAWLVDARGANPAMLSIVGASIGANLALAYAARHENVRSVVALSPGLDYRGVLAEPSVAGLGGRRVLLAASKDDEYSFMTVSRLASVRPEAATRFFENAGHGTAMFDAEPSFIEDVASWFAEG